LANDGDRFTGGGFIHAEINYYCAVVAKVHFGFYVGFEAYPVNGFEATEEDGILPALPITFEDAADAVEPFRLCDVVADEVVFFHIFASCFQRVVRNPSSGILRAAMRLSCGREG